MRYRDIHEEIPVTTHKMSYQQKRYLCSCEEKCDYYVHIEGIGNLCKNKAFKLGSYIRSRAMRYKDFTPSENTYRWSEKEIQFLIEWSKNGIKYGDYENIAEAIGRTKHAVRHKIRELRKKGMLHENSSN